jgi:hypothetical protein
MMVRDPSAWPYCQVITTQKGLSCRTFAANAVRFQLHVLAYNLGYCMRTLALPKAVEPWSLTDLREKLIMIDARVVSHGAPLHFRRPKSRYHGRCSWKSCRSIARLRAPTASA